jgi:hypothetical protein
VGAAEQNPHPRLLAELRDPRRRPAFHLLPFVTILVGPVELVNEIVAAGLDLAQAEAALQTWAEKRLAQREVA